MEIRADFQLTWGEGGWGYSRDSPNNPLCPLGQHYHLVINQFSLWDNSHWGLVMDCGGVFFSFLLLLFPYFSNIYIVSLSKKNSFRNIGIFHYFTFDFSGHSILWKSLKLDFNGTHMMCLVYKIFFFRWESNRIGKNESYLIGNVESKWVRNKEQREIIMPMVALVLVKWFLAIQVT